MSVLEGIFSLRIVTVDFYMEKPKPGLDPCFSEFRAKEIKKVPIIRIFGSNAEGQKACMHVHGNFPYFYIPYDKKDFESVDRAVYLIASSLDKAVNISLGQGSSDSQHVFKIVLVKGIPFYGYHQKEHQYLKIYMLNPRFVKRAANLLQNGAILGKIFHPHESHVPYILQFFIDYNLYGMSFLHVPKEVLKFRRKNEDDVIPYDIKERQVLDFKVAEKQSTSELELDIGSSFILNRFQFASKSSAHSNPGIESIWQDERVRRQNMLKENKEAPPLEIPVSQERLNVKPTESEDFYRIGLFNKLQQLDTSMNQTVNSTLQNSLTLSETSKEKKRTFNLKKLIANAVYPEECSQDDILTNASFIADHLSNRSIFQTSTKISQTSSIAESDDIFLDDTIVDEELVMSLTQPDYKNQSLRDQDMELLDVMQQLEEKEDGKEIDLDSSLAPLSQNLDLNGPPNDIVQDPETSNNSIHDESDNDCLNDFTIVMDDMDELLLKLSQPTIHSVEQFDGADDILFTPKKSKQKYYATTPTTPKRSTTKNSNGSPRTPKSVAKKYAPLPLVIQSHSLKKKICGSSLKTVATPSVIESDNSDEEIAPTIEEYQKDVAGYMKRQALTSLRKKLALTELRRKSISTDNEWNSEPSPQIKKRRKTVDFDKTHITCNYRTAALRRTERKLKVVNYVESPNLNKIKLLTESKKVNNSEINKLTCTKTIKSNGLTERKISPKNDSVCILKTSKISPKTESEKLSSLKSSPPTTSNLSIKTASKSIESKTYKNFLDNHSPKVEIKRCSLLNNLCPSSSPIENGKNIEMKNKIIKCDRKSISPKVNIRRYTLPNISVCNALPLKNGIDKEIIKKPNSCDTPRTVLENITPTVQNKERSLLNNLRQNKKNVKMNEKANKYDALKIYPVQNVSHVEVENNNLLINESPELEPIPIPKIFTPQKGFVSSPKVKLKRNSVEKYLVQISPEFSSVIKNNLKTEEVSGFKTKLRSRKVNTPNVQNVQTAKHSFEEYSASKRKFRLCLQMRRKEREERKKQELKKVLFGEDYSKEKQCLKGLPIEQDTIPASNDSLENLGIKNNNVNKISLRQTKKCRILLKRLKKKQILSLTSVKEKSQTPTRPYSIIVDNRYRITPLAGPSHLDRYKITNISLQSAAKYSAEDSDLEDDPTVHSFYEKSFAIDSPVFSEISASPEQVVKYNQQVNSNLSCETIIVITPSIQLETYEEVEKNCKKYDIPDMIHQKPFYSNYADVTQKKEVGHTLLNIPSKSLNDIEDFQSTLSNLEGFYDRRKKIIRNIGGVIKNHNQLREYLSSEKQVVITTCKLPPTKQEAKVWLKAKDYLKEKNMIAGEKENNFEEDSPIKIRRQKVVMLMESETGETTEDMDCSMRSISLTPLTPVLAKRNETANTKDSCGFTPLTTSGSESKLFKMKNRSKARVSLSQKLKDICLSNALEKCVEEETEQVNTYLSTNMLSKLSREDELRASRESLQSNETISSDVILAELEKGSFSKNLHSSQGSFDTSFGISAATLNNTFGFKVNLENLQQAKSDVEHNYLTTLSLEVFVSTREDLNPDPQFDEIMCIFYAIENSIPSTSPESLSKAVGIIITSDENNKTNPKFNGIDSDIEVKSVTNELELLAKLLELCAHWDPDIFVGYEIEMSSWGYVMERAKFLNLNIAPLLSRVPSQKVRDFVDEDREQLTDLDVETKLCGRILLDVWRLMRSEIALTSYTFENVMYHILHRRCPLHTYKNLSQWFQAPQTRWIVLEYFLERVRGTLELLDQLDLIGRTSEMAKLIGIQFYEVLSRGSQFRVESMMLRIAKPRNLVPLSPSIQQRAHMRAPEYLPLILEPQSRFYPDPVIVLDFQSLYPSMIMAYNYCFSTCLGRVEHLGQSVPFEFGASQLRVSPTFLRKLLDKELVTISPCGAVFVKREVREGILPRMLKEILDTRQMVKQSMKLHKNSTALQRILHSRQLGLKLIANVTYGYTAANFSGRMPCVEVGDSVVAKGRETLERAIKFVEANKNWNVKVVYGDTDSLFVLVPGRSREDAFKIGAEIAELVTLDNPQPVKLKLEKVYQPCILQTKKRYVGYMYESPEQEEPIYEAKGIETVRRDGCPVAAKMLEKCIRILFETADVSQVKNYVCRQFTKLLSGKANIQDLIFAKEFRGLKGYRPTACVPALELTRKWIQTDPRKIPRRGERVPFIVTNGPPGVPLIKLIRSPHDVLADEGLKINAIYYITKAIIPPINRCFLLIGADVNEWFTSLPRKVLFTPALSTANEIIATNATKKSTISQYFSSTNCMIDCGRQTKEGICTFCLKDKIKSIVSLEEKISKLQRGYHLTQFICQACCRRPNFIDCSSLDCPVLYVLEVKRRELTQIAHIQSIMDERF